LENCKIGYYKIKVLFVKIEIKKKWKFVKLNILKFQIKKKVEKMKISKTENLKRENF